MTARAHIRQAMYQLIEATHAISEITEVPVATLVVAMLVAAEREDSNELIEAAQFFAPLRLPKQPGLTPTSSAFEHFLSLIEKDDPALYKKLRHLD